MEKNKKKYKQLNFNSSKIEKNKNTNGLNEKLFKPMVKIKKSKETDSKQKLIHQNNYSNSKSNKLINNHKNLDSDFNINIHSSKVSNYSNENDNITSEIKNEKQVSNSQAKNTSSDLKLSSEIVNEKMREALEAQNPKNRKKSTILSLILLIVNIVFMIFIIKNLISDVDDFSLSVLISTQGNKLWWFGAGILVYALYIFVHVLAYRALLINLTGRKSWKIVYDVAVVGKYYDNVTPFAVGGQPLQIVALAKNKISAGVSTSIPLIKMIITTGMSALTALFFFIFGLPMLSVNSPLNQFLLVLLEIVGVIGLIITILLAIFMFLISSGTLFTRSFISGILRFGYKIKLVKNYRQTYRKVLNQVAEYKFSMKYLWKNKKLLFKLLFLNLIEVLAISSLPFFVVLALSNGIDENVISLLFICMTKYNLCQMASCYIPLPGGTGLMEISFIILFGSELGSYIVWGLLGWRFLSYYLILIHGFLHELIKIIINFSKNKKSKQSTLESVSEKGN